MTIDQIIRVLDVLAWPSTAFLLIWLARKQIRLLVPLIERIKYKDVEIKFGKRLADVTEDIGEAPLLDSGAPEEAAKIYALAEISPPSAVLEAWKDLEVIAQEKVRQLLPDGETYRKPLARSLDYLDYKGALSPSAASAARELKMLRNEAVHAGSKEISREDAIQYGAVASQIRAQIEAIDELPKVKLQALTLLILQLNHLIDSKRFEDISIKEVYRWIESEAVLSSLRERTDGESDLSMFFGDGPYAGFVPFYHEQMNRLAGGYAGDHNRKWGVENLGLCLLLAWTNELVQQGSGWYPSEM